MLLTLFDKILHNKYNIIFITLKNVRLCVTDELLKYDNKSVRGKKSHPRQDQNCIVGISYCIPNIKMS